MGKNDYILDKDRTEALRRLQGIERIEDPATISCLERIDVAAGWTCLEAGAGAGSIARWLGDRVGPGGRVVAVDLMTDLLEAAGMGGVEIRRMDLAEDPLDEASFDLVHERNVLVHIPERERVIRKLTDAIRPGGWILLEEPDLVADSPDPTAPATKRSLYARATGAIFAFVRGKGLDIHLGGRLYGTLTALGFEEVRAEGIAVTFHGGHPDHRSPHGDAFADIKEMVVEEGGITASEYDDFLALYDDPGFAWREGLRMMVWGRRP